MKGVRVAIAAALMVAVVVVGGCTSRAAPQGFSGLVSSGETLYASSAGGKVFALNAALRADDAAFPGAGEWEYAATRATKGMFGCGSSQAASIIYGAPVYDDNHLCVGTYDGKVLMLDGDSRSASQAFPQARSGEWQYPRGEDTIGPIVGAPVIDGDMVFVCSSTRDGGQTTGLVYALDRSFGDELWVSPALDGKLWVTPAVEDGVVYVTTFDGHIYALSAQTGERMPWSYEANVGFVSSPLIQDGMVFAGSFDRMLYAIEVGADSPAWSYHAGNWFWATPVMSGGVLYAPNMDGNLYAFNAGTGDLAWTRPFDAGSAIAAGPLLAGDKVVVATKDGNVFLVDAATGAGVRVPNPDNEKATTVNATVIAAPVLHQGLVYVLPQNSTVTAVDPVAATVKYQFSLETE